MINNNKYNILKLIFISDLIFCMTAFIVINILIPHRFESDAKKTIINEIFMIKHDTISETRSTYLTSSVQFVYPEDLMDNYTTSSNASYLRNYLKLQRIEKQEVIEYVEGNDLETDECYSFHSGNGNYIVSVFEDTADYETESAPLIMYINIKPFFRYNYLWNMVLGSLFAFVSLVTLKIGSDINRQIEERHEMEKAFFQNSSYELKTPLMAIQGYAEGIYSGIEDNRKASLIIVEESERMARLIDELLYVSKIDSNHFDFQMEKYDIRELVYESLNMILPLADHKRMSLDVQMPEYPLYVKCDGTQILKAIENLLSNAVSHADKRISVVCERKSNEAVIHITDDGNGISPKDLPYIFERFYSSRKGGTGIGLSLAKNIVEKHGGTITGENSKEKGAVFTIRMKCTE